jgi:large subunit ribosomal protein L24
MSAVKKGDTVVVVTGKERTKTGKVLKVFERGERILIEKLNIVKKHTKPTQGSPKGGIVEKEAPIAVSNVMLFCSKCSKGVRAGHKVTKDSKKRVCKSCGGTL